MVKKAEKDSPGHSWVDCLRHGPGDIWVIGEPGQWFVWGRLSSGELQLLDGPFETEEPAQEKLRRLCDWAKAYCSGFLDRAW